MYLLLLCRVINLNNVNLTKYLRCTCRRMTVGRWNVSANTHWQNARRQNTGLCRWNIGTYIHIQDFVFIKLVTHYTMFVVRYPEGSFSHKFLRLQKSLRLANLHAQLSSRLGAKLAPSHSLKSSPQVPDWANFLLMDDCLLWEARRLCKNDIFGLLYSTVKVMH
jgi:hypothetical protein